MNDAKVFLARTNGLCAVKPIKHQDAMLFDSYEGVGCEWDVILGVKSRVGEKNT